MSEDRRSLASLIISRGSRVDGRPIIDSRGRIQLARAGLMNASVQPGDVVLLIDLSAADTITAMLAVWLLDAVPLIAPGIQDLPEDLQRVCRLHQDLVVTPATNRTVVPGLGRTAVLMPTSGSTGKPKTARRGIAGVRVEAAGYRDYLELVPADRVAVPVPITHSYGWGLVMAALLTGCDIDTTPTSRLRTLANLMDSGAVSVVVLTPALARLLLDVKRSGDQSVRCALVGAGGVPDALDAAFQERFRRPLHRGYGSTETGGMFLGPRGIGRPIAGIQVRRPVGRGRGELVLEMSAPVEGTLGRTPSDVWHTGDIVECDADGIYHHIERVRSAVRLNSRFVDPEPLTRGLREISGATDVQILVLGRDGTPEIEDLYAVVETRSTIAERTLESYFSQLPDSIPRPLVLQFSGFPRNILGKLDRDALTTLVRKESRHGR
ncbi:long-chain fatty acid--CoA ligase [Streptacidiphilus sp. PB12-B1b]|uniref:AMP-binding protein n=1 Tax=Streptacidiphilus sp. PB12-B1b TaxID=2705012 RepID=UPI0015FE7E5B|nr:AMP-binding protein [Streptacidiphilus sp. PB12-B1b]QMU74633.1 long-chain fatty acid--CoA ligase [Streptacidiphilus sp. PB12-B1b]